MRLTVVLPVLQRHFYGGFDGACAVTCEECAVEAGDRAEAIGQRFGHRIGGPEQRRVVERGGLLGNRSGDTRVRVAVNRRPDRADGVVKMAPPRIPKRVPLPRTNVRRDRSKSRICVNGNQRRDISRGISG